MSAIGIIFPGQGSQSIGMLSDLAAEYGIIKDTFTKVTRRLGYDVWQLVQEGPLDKLNQTEYTQVAMLTADVAIFNVLREFLKTNVAMMAGHSLGEYAALVCAGSLNLEDAAELVAHRGRLMQETVPLGEGAMAAIIGLADTQVQEICLDVSNNQEKVSIANLNAIGQVVIAGNSQAVERAIVKADGLGALLAKIIPVSVPCHCQLLKSTATQFKSYLDDTKFLSPCIPVISNVDVSIYENPLVIKELLMTQLYSPVRWVETIQNMHKQGIECVIECGPGKVLSGLVKRTERSMQTINTNDIASIGKAIQLLEDN